MARKFSEYTFIILCALFMTAAAAAASVSAAGTGDLSMQGSSNPSGDLAFGETVSCTYLVDYDFDSDQESLMFHTDLNDPIWVFTLINDGVEQVKPKASGKYKSLSGFELYYDRVYSSQVRAELTGKVPDNIATGTYSLIDVTHYDAGYNVIDTAAEQRLFISPSDVGSLLTAANNNLAALRSDINAASSAGADTSAAEGKYLQAQNMLIDAENEQSSSKKSTYITNAENLISEGRALLSSSSAQNALSIAQSEIISLGTIISKLEAAGLGSDSRIWAVKSYNDNAQTLLTLAQDRMKSGNTADAENYAKQSQAKAFEGYTCAKTMASEKGINLMTDIGLWYQAETVSKAPVISPTSGGSGISSIITSAVSSGIQAGVETGISSALESSGISSGIQSSGISEINDIITSSGISGSAAADQSEIDEVIDLLHSEVSFESGLKILGKLYDVTSKLVGFLISLLSTVSSSL